ncbi:hypothetical protein AWZ03_002067 [Drosophila navojoa]|uniref:Malic enzyme n=1 Tax=Drosophila navojoa TaxID=7232 RepID=A0A484BS54_DRONA|nr:NADP-dependent malic enzyme-like [Drosophila navojoa]XP_017961479.1 NADP-dependent malic enzyme-like [Drosophila navojoa]TDG51607.1 hypothetical protein AWZ03_002067 [Drosophila navojoa]
MACGALKFGLRQNLSSLLASKHQSSVNKSRLSPPLRNWHASVLKTDYRKVWDPKYNKGTAFTHKERQILNIIGLYPSCHRTEKEQLFAVYTNFKAHKTNLGRYIYLRALRARQERLYYRFIIDRIEDVMPIIYTPTVGIVCQNFSHIYHTSMGLYVSKYDKGHMTHVLNNWPETDIRAVCVTDGERILGLGDLGANGMGISVGKLDLYTALGRIPPQYLLPVVLDVGTNNQQLLCDPMYIGVREERCKGEEYDELVNEFMQSVVKTFGVQTLIHFEDFATPNAFRFIKKYQNEYCYINDDIQGTASCGLAGFLAAEHITKKPLNEHVIMFAGAGSAALGVGNLLLKELLSRKITEEDAVKNIYFIDVDGIVTKDRKKFIIPDIKRFAKDLPPEKNLEKLVEDLKPSILLGATGQGGIFTEKILRSMAKNHKHPAIVACSNPTNKSECTAEQAYNFTEGRALYASGSPFPPVVINGKRLTPSQANNAFSFPGVALGVLCTKPHTITDEVFLVTAHAIAEYAREFAPNENALYPPVKEAANVAFHVGVAVAKHIISCGAATIYPIPKDITKHVKDYQYYTDLGTALPSVWPYPELARLPLPDRDEDTECAD